ncbi:type I toxin-antitoxin system toxin Ldr family protein [Escherichia coli]|nr:type I toxin-antitoxin system toxin Ldr family protein [Escherichia coli]MDX5531153.1 type I toxin-antitoxin system toxin Ldr family protein [Escherichia coli]
MTLAELGMAFWHDLAAPVIAGILAWHSCQYDRELAEQAEVTCHAGVRLP